MLMSNRILLAAGAAASIYDADATALFARMTTQPSTARKGLLNTTILAMKAAGVWAPLDLVNFFAAHSAQAATLNWKGTVGAFTISASPTLNVGYVTVSSDRLNYGAGVTDLPQYAAGASSILIHGVNIGGGNSDNTVALVAQQSSNYTLITPVGGSNGNRPQAYINTTLSDTVIPSLGTSFGEIQPSGEVSLAGTRTGDTVRLDVRYNTDSMRSVSATSAVTARVTPAAFNAFGYGSTARNLAAGGYLTDTQVGALFQIFRDYYSALGANP